MKKTTKIKTLTVIVFNILWILTGCGNSVDIKAPNKPQSTTSSTTTSITTATPTSCTTGTCTSSTSTCSTGTCTSATSSCTSGTCPATSAKLTFASIRGAELDTYYTTNSITIQGVEGLTTARTSTGTLVVNGIDTDVSEYDVMNGDTVAVKVRSSEDDAVTQTVAVEMMGEIIYFDIAT
jgi:hypothetical protein